jgi:hypothetical protein
MHASTIDVRRFDQPDQQLNFAAHGRIDIIKMPHGTVGMHGIFEPGWTWAADEKPLLGNPDSCPMGHIGYCISGELVVRMIGTGAETHIRTGDFFEIPPGHDAYVEGRERCECILFGAAEHPATASDEPQGSDATNAT